MSNHVPFPVFVELFNSKVKANDPSFKKLENGLYTPQKHLEVCQWLEAMEGEPLFMLQAYREFSKSHLLNLYAAWLLYKNPNTKILFLSATSMLSSDAAYYLRQTIEQHPLTASLVPNDKSLWQRTIFTVKRSVIDREPSVKCTSVSAAKTGLHPDLIIVDDMEVPENCNSKEGREKLRRAFEELVPMSKRSILFAGTPHSEETLYADLEAMGCKSLKIPFFGLKDGQPCKDLKEGTLQLPELHDEAWIEERKRKLSTAKFESQYLLIRRSAYDVVLDPEKCKTYNGKITVETVSMLDRLRGARPELSINNDTIRDLKAFWDTALGRKHGDQSVIAVVASTYSGDVYVVDLVQLPEVDERTGYDKQMQAVLDTCERNHCNQVYVETNFNRTAAIELRRYAKQVAKKKINIKEVARTRHTGNKHDNIADAIEPLIKIGRFYVRQDLLNDTDLAKEMRSFPHGQRDDTIDAITGALQALRMQNVTFNREGMLSENGFSSTPRVMNING